MVNDYVILCNSISLQNSLANAIVEIICHTIGNVIYTSTIKEIDLDNQNPSEGILSSAMCHRQV